MKIQLNKVLKSYEQLNEVKTFKFGASEVLKLLRLTKAIFNEVDLYRKASIELYKKYGAPETPHGFDLQELPPEKYQELVSELEELVKEEVELPDIKIPISVFDKAGVYISLQTLEAIEWFIEGTEEMFYGKEKAKVKKAKNSE